MYIIYVLSLVEGLCNVMKKIPLSKAKSRHFEGRHELSAALYSISDVKSFDLLCSFSLVAKLQKLLKFVAEKNSLNKDNRKMDVK